MTEPSMTDVRDRLERLSRLSDDDDLDALLESVRRERGRHDSGAPRYGNTRRRAPVSVVVAFAAVAAITVGAVLLSTRSQSSAPPASTPRPTIVRPAPTESARGSVAALYTEPAMVSSTEGWLCDLPLRHTVDSGATWRSTSVPIPRTDAITCAFLSGSQAWIGTSGRTPARPPAVIRVLAGPHEQVTRVGLPGADHRDNVVSLTFINNDHGWALTSQGTQSQARNELYGTVDGGMQWKLIRADAPISGGLRFTSATRGWAVDGAVLRRTDDGGRSWVRVPIVLPTTVPDPVLVLVSLFGRHMVVVGVTSRTDSLAGAGFVDISDDSGRTWASRSLPNNIGYGLDHLPTLFDVIDPSHWRVPTGLGWVTNDAGISWHRGISANFVLNGGYDGGVNFATPDVGWQSICKGVTGTKDHPEAPACLPEVAGTTDGGRTWTLLARP